MASSTPPKRMTWGRAGLIIAVGLVFDGLSVFFLMFWFFAPQVVGASVSTYLGGGLLGSAAGTVAETFSSVFGGPEIAVFGIVMSMLIGFLGWLSIGGALLLFNRRIFKEEPINSLWYLGSIIEKETPFINALPGLTVVLVVMLHKQIQKEKKAYKKWLIETNGERLARQRFALARLAAARAEEAAEEDEEEAAEEEAEVPEPGRDTGTAEAYDPYPAYDPEAGVPSASNNTVPQRSRAPERARA